MFGNSDEVRTQQKKQEKKDKADRDTFIKDAQQKQLERER